MPLLHATAVPGSSLLQSSHPARCPKIAQAVPRICIRWHINEVRTRRSCALPDPLRPVACENTTWLSRLPSTAVGTFTPQAIPFRGVHQTPTPVSFAALSCFLLAQYPSHPRHPVPLVRLLMLKTVRTSLHEEVTTASVHLPPGPCARGQ